MPFWARKTGICAFFKPLNIWSFPLFWGGPRPYFQPPFPPITPALLFTSEVSVFYQHGFPYLFLPSCVSFCGTWYTVCSVLMCFGELCSAAIVLSPPPHTHTRKHMDMFPAMVGNIGEGCLCVFPLISIISHIHFEHYLKSWVEDGRTGPVVSQNIHSIISVSRCCCWSRSGLQPSLLPSQAPLQPTNKAGGDPCIGAWKGRDPMTEPNIT